MDGETDGRETETDTEKDTQRQRHRETDTSSNHRLVNSLQKRPREVEAVSWSED